MSAAKPPGGGRREATATLDQYGWVLIADGAAWGIDYLVHGASTFLYSVIRLDLATGTTTTWMEGQSKTPWPLGVDGEHGLYAAPYDGPL